MARNRVSVSQVIDDFIITQGEDDFVSGASDYALRSFALRGIREMGFDGEGSAGDDEWYDTSPARS